MKIHTLDLHFQNLDHAIAAYLVETANTPFLVETGPASTLPALKSALASHGLKPADIRHIFVTHIHLDHAGAAGWWAQQGARVYVHQVGAPHLIDPSRLLASAGRIYGAKMDTLWGDVLPAPREQITALADGDTIDIDGVLLTALDTPGHAWHHHTYRLDDIAFTGDAAGVRMPHSQWISVPAPPPEFKLEIWLQTLDRLEAESYTALYPTHYGRIKEPARHLEEFRKRLLAATELVGRMMAEGAERDELLKRYQEWNLAQATDSGVAPDDFARFEAANPLYMSVDGIMRYWRRKAEKEGSQ